MVKIKQNIPLILYTTFNIGGKARFFVEVKSVEELAEAIKFKRDNRLPHFVLGGGSNILVSDDGFDGLVIKIDIRGLWINDLRSRFVDNFADKDRYSRIGVKTFVQNTHI